MTGWLLLAALAAAAVIPPLLQRRTGHAASPAALASLSLVTLVSPMVLLVAGATCLVRGLLTGDQAALPLAVAGIGLAGGMVLRAALTAIGIRRTRRTIAELARSAACGRKQDGAIVVAIDGPPAFLADDVVVISRRAVGTLEEREIAAVIAHERAHAVGRHAALTTAAAALRNSLLGFAPARRCELVLRTQLELLTDEQAAAAVGARHPVATAITRLRSRPASHTTQTVIDHRLNRLLHPQVRRPHADRMVWAATTTIAGLTMAGTCAAGHTSWLLPSAGLCLVLTAWVLHLLAPLRRAKGAPSRTAFRAAD